MADKCVYCDCEIRDDRAVSICDRCGTGVWGPKMFLAIKGGMANSRQKGDLEQGNVK